MRSWRSRPVRETQTSGANQPNPAVSTTSSGEEPSSASSRNGPPRITAAAAL